MFLDFCYLLLRKSVLIIGLWTVLSGSTQAHDFSIIGNSVEITQIEDSFKECPSLSQKLDSLRRSGQFEQIRISDPTEIKRLGPFEAAVSDREILITPAWLSAQRLPYSDIRHQDTILPDNLCFGFGHLASHLEYPPPSRSADMATWVHERLTLESQAYLRAWAYVLDAAVRRNLNRPLTGRQFSDLLLNLRYRFAILGALNVDGNSRLRPLRDGNISLSPDNIDAIVKSLSHSKIADLE